MQINILYCKYIYCKKNTWQRPCTFIYLLVPKNEEKEKRKRQRNVIISLVNNFNIKFKTTSGITINLL